MYDVVNSKLLYKYSLIKGVVCTPFYISKLTICGKPVLEI
uniref:Uncharacterized protein n=1 Tax=Anguilla anguilla TaxID=7936 RepID=A0A0E9QES8_ANGAN